MFDAADGPSQILTDVAASVEGKAPSRSGGPPRCADAPAAQSVLMRAARPISAAKCSAVDAPKRWAVDGAAPPASSAAAAPSWPIAAAIISGVAPERPTASECAPASSSSATAAAWPAAAAACSAVVPSAALAVLMAVARAVQRAQRSFGRGNDNTKYKQQQ